MARKHATHRREFTMRTCQVCCREYKAFPVGKKSYAGECRHCGSVHDIFGKLDKYEPTSTEEPNG